MKITIKHNDTSMTIDESMDSSSIKYDKDTIIILLNAMVDNIKKLEND